MRGARRFVGLYLLAVALFGGEASSHAQLRTWTSRSGQTVEAVLLEASAGWAVLKAQEGGTLRIKTANLSDVDQAFIVATKQTSPASPATPSSTTAVIPAKGIRLPAFAVGEHRNLFAMYEAPRYRVTVNRVGVPELTFLGPDGTPSPNTAKLVSRVLQEGPTGGAHPLRLAGWKEDLTPTVISDSLEMTAILDGGVELTVQMQFEKDRIEIRGWTDRSKLDGRKLRVDLGLAFNALTGEENYNALRLVCKPEKGREITTDFNEPWNGTALDLKEALVSGGAWAGASTTVVPGALRQAPLKGWIYPGTPLREGFMLFINKGAADSRSADEFVRISFSFE